MVEKTVDDTEKKSENMSVDKVKAKESKVKILLPLDPTGERQTEWFCINGHEFTVKRGEEVPLTKAQYDYVNSVMLQRQESLRTKLSLQQKDEE